MSAEFLSGHSPAEKTAYLAAIASIATTDNVATENETNYLLNLVDVAGLDDVDKDKIIAAAKDTSTDSLKKSLDVLKTSDLRFSLVADLIAFAEADSNLAEEEKRHIADVARYLGVNDVQLETLNEFVRESAAQPAAMGVMDDASSTQQGFLDNLGLGKKLQGAGINIGSIAKGLMAFVGPMILGNMISKGMKRSGGGTGMSQQGGGGLGSLVESLTGGRGFSGIGGFLSKLFILVLIFTTTFFTSCGPNDAKIQAAVESAINSNPDMSGVTATVKDGVATISGEVKDATIKSAAEATVAKVDGVKSVVNNCTVAPPPPPPAPVVIAEDETLIRNVNDAIKDYPGVKASVKEGVVTLTGEIKRANLQKLMQSLNALRPKKIENQLTIN